MVRGEQGMKRALITGGSGFIGSYLSQEISNHGYQVTILDYHRPTNSLIEFVEGDILDLKLLNNTIKNCDIVFHLAGVLGTEYLCDKVQEAIDINIKGSVNVFETAKVFGVKVINTGLIPEWDNPYMITKKAVMRLGRMYHNAFKVDITTLEFTHVYGPGQRTEPYHKAIPNFIVRALKNEPLEIYGSGQKYMDCIFVEDTAKALRLAGESTQVSGKVFQIGRGEGIKVVDLAYKIISLTNSKSSLKFLPMRQGEPEGNGSFIAVDLREWLLFFNWTPKTSLEEGLLKTIEWYKKCL